ncbi:MAG: tetratricopeptide repeat protein [candidate division Zixibacteria bacterium]|nr:tetratricopeptide repeat protein [candidate division Zixibacteria bacterium]
MRQSPSTRMSRRTVGLCLAIGVITSTLTGCVYFNTFYNARRTFNNAEKQNKKADQGHGGISANKQFYEDAITKAAKVVQKHPKSKYHDDALFMIGVSYFRIENFTKSEAAFRELLATHPQSEFVEESQLYLARCRTSLGDEQSAFRAFTELAASARKPEWRAEAIYQRGLYFADHGAPDSAAASFQAILEDYPKSDRSRESRLRAGDMLRRLKRPQDAIALYHPLTTHDDPHVRYQALTGIGLACYEAGQDDSGIAIFRAMADSSAYYDSIGTIRLLLARGLKEVGDVAGAVRQYEQIEAALEKTTWSAEACFRMAEIKQFNDNDIVAAKDLYEQSRQEYAQGDLARQALTRSSNISKLENFRKELGRSELAKASAARAAASVPYDPASLPRWERVVTYSTAADRPPDDILPSTDTSGVAGADTLTYGPAAPEDSTGKLAEGTFGPPAPSDSAPLGFGPPTPEELATASADSMKNLPPEAFGPPTSMADSSLDPRHAILLPDAVWRSLVEGGDSLLGPPSPADLYAFGEGNLLGPPTPAGLPLITAPTVDSAYLQEQEALKAAREERQTEFKDIQSAATTQIELAELYRFDLAAPESAIVEYDDMVQRFSGSPFAAHALLASAEVYRSDLKDSMEADRRLHRILDEYPNTDYAGDAIAILGLQGTPADTGYPAVEYQRAEDLYLAGKNPKQALAAFKGFIQKYPHSRLVPHAEYAVAVLTDRYFAAGDSSVIWAYQAITANYPLSEVAQAANDRLTTTVARPKKRAAPPPVKPAGAAGKDSTAVKGPKADTAVQKRLPLAPRPKLVGTFVWPTSEVNLKEHIVVYQILIDFSGQISRYDLIKPSPSADINAATERALKLTTFWADSIPPESLGNVWYRYEIKVTPPAQQYDPLQQYIH